MNRGYERGRLTREWWLVLVFSAAILGLAVAAQVTARFDYVIYDAIQRRLAAAPHEDVLLVTIDDRSIQEMGAWPWPRDRMAGLVERIAAARPKALGLDVLLLDNGDRASDQALAAALRQAGPTYLPILFEIPGKDGARFALAEPIEPFRSAAAGFGQVNVAPDSDGLVRRAYLRYGDGSHSWPAMAALVAGYARPSAAGIAPGKGALVGQQPVLIGYSGPSGTFPSISASSVLRGEVPPEFIRGRRVLVGVTANGVGDVYATSASVDGSLTPGVEIQANLVSTLLSGRPVVPANLPTIYAFALLAMLAVMIGKRFLRPRWTMPLILALILGVLAASLLLLRYAALWLPPASALAAIVLVYPLWTWRKLATASNYLSGELESSSQDTIGLLEREETGRPPGDRLDRQMYLLSRAMQRERDLRRFLVDRLTQMPDYVVVTDTAGAVVFANASARRLFADLNGGGELVAADDLLTYLHRASSSGRTPIRFAAATKTHGIAWHCEAETWTGGYFDVRFEPQRNSDDELVGYVVRIVDKTDATLTQRQRDEALQLLSHDMRAPQSSIISFLDTLAISQLPPAAADRIRGYAHRTLQLADDFVHFARAQTVDMQFEEVDLGAVAFEAVDSLWPQAGAKGVTVALDLPDEELPMSGNGSLLCRMLINLIDNAIKFGPESGRVDVACRRTAGPSGAVLVVTVSDQGEGIPPERMSTLYERFQSTSPAGTHGVGLGLAFVHTVVVRHHGTIRCRSGEGPDGKGGTTFTVELPAGVSARAGPPPPHSALHSAPQVPSEPSTDR